MFSALSDNDSDGDQHDHREAGGRTVTALQRLMASEKPDVDNNGMSWNRLGLSVTNCPGLRGLIEPIEAPDPKERRQAYSLAKSLSPQRASTRKWLETFLKDNADSFRAYKLVPAEPPPSAPARVLRFLV